MTPARLMGVLAAICSIMSGTAAAQKVISVRPTATVVPNNLLRLSLVFSERPLQPVIPQLRLLRSDGSAVDEPFDPQELWSPDGHFLTVLLQPGRVKSGLVAHDTVGSPLAFGGEVLLTWKGETIASWSVAKANASPPDPSRWRIVSPRAGTRAPIRVDLDSPIDAMDRDLIAIAGPDGRSVRGRAALRAGERRWSFLPDKPWRAGGYHLVTNAALEDPSGNRIGQTFEHRPGAQGATAHDLRISFEIR